MTRILQNTARRHRGQDQSSLFGNEALLDRLLQTMQNLLCIRPGRATNRIGRQRNGQRPTDSELTEANSRPRGHDPWRDTPTIRMRVNRAMDALTRMFTELDGLPTSPSGPGTPAGRWGQNHQEPIILPTLFCQNPARSGKEGAAGERSGLNGNALFIHHVSPAALCVLRASVTLWFNLFVGGLRSGSREPVILIENGKTGGRTGEARGKGSHAEGENRVIVA